MTSPQTTQTAPEQPTYNPASETDRVLGILELYNNHAKYIRALSHVTSQPYIQPTLTMSFLGNLGRFGNQIFQYAFLRICAKNAGAKVECSPWIGQILFDHTDAPVSKRLTPAIEYREIGRDRRIGESFFDYIPEYIPYIEKVSGAPCSRVDSNFLESGLMNVDLWGFFQFHTRYLRPYKAYFRDLFQPVSDLSDSLERSLNLLRANGKTIVGVHVRRGEYLTFPQPRYALPVPSQWYCHWLANLWPTLDNPVLFLCSDDINSVLPDFEAFSPITLKDLDVQLPARFRDLKLAFYADFFMLSHCDVVATSNSTFGFAACMLNKQGTHFVRPDWNADEKFVRFDPWDSTPLLYIQDEGARFSKRLRDIARVAYVNNGIWGALKSVFLYAPLGYAKLSGLRFFLAYKTNGIRGILKTSLSPLGISLPWQNQHKKL